MLQFHKCTLILDICKKAYYHHGQAEHLVKSIQTFELQELVDGLVGEVEGRRPRNRKQVREQKQQASLKRKIDQYDRELLQMLQTLGEDMVWEYNRQEFFWPFYRKNSIYPKCH